MFENLMEASMLYDFYGKLLSNRQAEVMRLYHEENLSLAEIAKEFGNSRQAVYDTLKNAEKTLKDYEDKLGLVKSFSKKEEIISQIREKLKSFSKNDEKIKRNVIEIDELLKKIEF